MHGTPNANPNPNATPCCRTLTLTNSNATPCRTSCWCLVAWARSGSRARGTLAPKPNANPNSNPLSQLIFHFMSVTARLNEEIIVGVVMVTILAVEFLVVGTSQPGAVYLWNHPDASDAFVNGTIPFTSEKQTDLVTLTLTLVLTLTLTLTLTLNPTLTLT